MLIAAAAWPSRRRSHLRLSPAAAGLAGAGLAGTAGAGISPSLGPLGYWLAVAAAAVVLALVGGPLVAAVPVVLVLGWWRPRWVPWLAFAAMCVAGALAMTGLGHGPQTGAGAFGWPAQAAALVALAAALTPTARGPRRRTGPRSPRGRGARRVTTLRDAPGAPASWPFTPIEELDVYLENAQEPSLVQLETHAPGHLDRAALEAALAGVLAADPAARRHLAATSRWSRRLRWEAAAPAIRTGSRPAPGGDAGLLTVTGWRSPGQLAALREQLSAWPMSLNEHRGAADPGGGT